MADSVDSKAFQSTKIGFFKNYNQSTYENIALVTDDVKIKAQQIDYRFLHENKKRLEQEFSSLLNALKKSQENRQDFWLYCLYCSCLLEQYYDGYDQPAKMQAVQEQKQEIIQRLKGEALPKSDEGFVDSVCEKLKNGFAEFISLPLHPSKLRDQLAISNFWRIYWVFCRLFVENGLKSAKNSHFIDKLQMLLGKQIQVDAIIHALEAPTFALNCFSVGIFATRLLVNLIFLGRHVFLPGEKEKQVDLIARLKDEWSKRGIDIINHATWAAVNFIANFSQLVHLSVPVATWIMVAFMSVDVFCLLYMRESARDEYLNKMAEFSAEIQLYGKGEADTDDQIHCAAQIAMLEKQKIELSIQWETKEATLNALILTTFLLMGSFAVSMLAVAPVVVMLSYLACILAIAMYLSESSYANMVTKQLHYEYARKEASDADTVAKLKEEYTEARNALAFSLIKNTLVPVCLLATYVICLPAAVTLTLLYVTYEVASAYLKHEREHAEEAREIVDHHSGIQFEEESLCCIS